MDATTPRADVQNGSAPPAASLDDAPPRRRRAPFVVLALVLIGGAAGATLWWLNARHFEVTDDAAIDTNISQVAAQVSGRTTAILVDDNQLVKQGQVLVELDPRDWQVKLDQAKAQLATARAQLAQAQASAVVQQAAIDQATANVAVAEADAAQAQQDYDRFTSIDPRAVTKQQIDNATAGWRTSRARLGAAQRALAGQKAQLISVQAQIQAAEAGVKNAEVGVENAELQLSYTKVAAPQAGYTTKRSVEPGNYVMAGQSIVSVVPTETWVAANFKETQLADMKPGQPVDITVDAYPGVLLRGKVDSFQAGTGGVFSTIPVENATGNWVKVLQRLPVKIVFDDPKAKEIRLSPGMSVTATVRVR